MRPGAGVVLALLAVASVAAEAGGDPKLPDYRPSPKAKFEATLRGGYEPALLDVVEAWLDEFSRFCPTTERSIDGPGSAAAKLPPGEGLAKGMRDFEPRVHELEPGEVLAFAKIAGHDPTAVRPAYEAVAVYVDAKNPLPRLTLAELDAIFSAERRRGGPEDVSTWGKLGLTGEWADRAILPRGPTRPSGAGVLVKERVLQGAAWKPNVEAADSPAGAGRAEPGVIALGPIGILPPPGRRAVPLAGDDGKPYDPTGENVLSGKYPLARPLFVYVNRDPRKPLATNVREFLRYLLSKQGQETASKAGYVPLSAVVAASERAKIEK